MANLRDKFESKVLMYLNSIYNDICFITRKPFIQVLTNSFSSFKILESSLSLEICLPFNVVVIITPKNQ